MGEDSIKWTILKNKISHLIKTVVCAHKYQSEGKCKKRSASKF